MKHERLHVVVLLFLHQGLIQITGRTVERVLRDADIRVLCQRKTPENISGHPMIAFAGLPPSPTSVRVLKIIEPIEPGLHHLLELF